MKNVILILSYIYITDLGQIQHLQFIAAQSLLLKDQQVQTWQREDPWEPSLMTARMVQILLLATQASISSEQGRASQDSLTWQLPLRRTGKE